MTRPPYASMSQAFPGNPHGRFLESYTRADGKVHFYVFDPDGLGPVSALQPGKYNGPVIEAVSPVGEQVRDLVVNPHESFNAGRNLCRRLEVPARRNDGVKALAF